jgi:TetR/AcrR family transcriptional regulator, transcriptional repressor for nem operon
MTTRRARILDAATRLIQQRGYERTSVDDVIRESGLSGKSHFYHYFKSKEALGFEVLEHQYERFAERGLALLREPLIDPRERLELFVDTLVALQERDGGAGASAFGGLIGELADAHEGFRRRLDQVFARWARQLESLFIELEPRLRDGADPSRLAHFVIAALEGGMLMARVTRDARVLRGIGNDLKRYVASHFADGVQGLSA